MVKRLPLAFLLFERLKVICELPANQLLTFCLEHFSIKHNIVATDINVVQQQLSLSSKPNLQPTKCFCIITMNFSYVCVRTEVEKYIYITYIYNIKGDKAKLSDTNFTVHVNMNLLQH